MEEARHQRSHSRRDKRDHAAEAKAQRERCANVAFIQVRSLDHCSRNAKLREIVCEPDAEHRKRDDAELGRRHEPCHDDGRGDLRHAECEEGDVAPAKFAAMLEEETHRENAIY